MTLQKLLLQNFQCHSKLEIEFDKNVTTIVGPSDTGKSAIIRAIRWLVANKPTGDSFRREGSKKTIVGLKFDDGRKLVRKKSDSTNEMSLDGKCFKAFGTDIPDEVRDVLNLHEVSFQFQHDSPFWLSSTAGQVSRELNAIVNLDIIDTTLKNIASERRVAMIRRDDSKAKLKETEEAVEGLSYVDKLCDDFGRLERLEEKSVEKAARLARIHVLLEDVKTYRGDKRTCRKAHSEGLKVCGEGEEYQKRMERLGKLVSLVNKAIELEKGASIEIPTIAEIELVEDVCKEMLESLSQEKKLEKLVQECVAKRKDWLETDQALIGAKWELKEKTKGVCPLCGSKIGEIEDDFSQT